MSSSPRGAPDAECDDLIYDFLVQFLSSPAWTTPVDNFLDEHCFAFEDKEENKLVYTSIHNDFTKMIEDLLETHLAILGITNEQFVEAVTRGKHLRQVVFGHVLAADDFLLFKRMMVRRNHDLELESLRSIQAIEAAHAQARAGSDPQQQVYGAGPEDERAIENEFRAAVVDASRAHLTAASLPSAAAASSSSSAAMSATASAAVAALSLSGYSDEELVEMALKASVLDLEISNIEFRQQQAELEEALALSLTFETERLRALALHAETKAGAVAVPAAVEGHAGKTERSRQASALEEFAAVQVAATMRPVVQIAPSCGAGAGAGPAASVPVALTPAPAPAPVPVSALASLPAETVASRTAESLERQSAAFRAALGPQLDTDGLLRAEAKVSEAELRRRAEYLRKQKDLYVQKKRREREAALRRFEEETASTSAASSSSSSASASAPASATASSLPSSPLASPPSPLPASPASFASPSTAGPSSPSSAAPAGAANPLGAALRAKLKRDMEATLARRDQATSTSAGSTSSASASASAASASPLPPMSDHLEQLTRLRKEKLDRQEAERAELLREQEELLREQRARASLAR